MPKKLIYNWDEIQEYYDDDHSLRECQEKFGFGNTAYTKAIKSGRLKTRKQSKSILNESNENSSETTLKEAFASLKFEERALEKKVIISKPTYECSYDRVADIDGTLYRVQVRYSSELKRGCTVVHCMKWYQKKRIPFKESEIDAIVCYCENTKNIYWISKEFWKGKTALSLRHEPPKNGQIKNILFAEQFVW